MQKINKKQAEDIEKLQTQSTNLEIRETKGEGKIDENEQYDRRQNLEIVGIPSKTGENTNKIVQEVAKLMKLIYPKIKFLRPTVFLLLKDLTEITMKVKNDK